MRPSEDPLGPARGILRSMVLGMVVWVAVIFAVRGCMG